jgi:dipeptidyl aminopeptidase/acylaminoacyl peptidase
MAILAALITACGQGNSTAPPVIPTAVLATPAPSTATPIPPVATKTASPTEIVTPAPTEPDLTAAPVEVEEITFQSDHFKVVGDLQIPSNAGKHPAIIMVHGDGGIDRYDSGKYRPIMERFLRAGYAVFSWDKPGTRESTGEFIDGAWIITDRASILVDAVELLKDHPAIDPQRIGVWGISQAGAVMPMALTMSDDIAFMIVVSGPGVDAIDQTAYLIGKKLLCEGYSVEEANLAEESYAGVCKATTYDEYRENKTNLVQFPSALIFTGSDIIPEEEWSPWDRGVDAFFNPIEVIEQTTIPVLAFFGEKDTQVDPFQGAQAYEQALQKAGNQHYRVELIPGVDHSLVLCETGCMMERDRRSGADWLKYAPEFLDLMEEWLAKLSASLEEQPVALETISVDTVGQVERLRTLSGHREKVYALDFSGDGAYLASSSADREIIVWDVRTGQLAHTLSLPVATHHNIAFSRVGHLLASADTIWDVQSWQGVQTFVQEVAVVAFSPDGLLLAIAPAGQPIVLWEVASGQVVRTFDDPAENLFRCLAFSPDGTLLAAGSNNNIVRLWNVAGGGLAHTIQHDIGGQPLDHILDLAFSPDGRVLASSGTDLKARLWDVEAWQVIHELRIGDAPTGLAFSPDGTILASSGPELKLWDVESGKLLRTLPHGSLIAVAFSPDGTLLASGGYDHQIYLWSMPR